MGIPELGRVMPSEGKAANLALQVNDLISLDVVIFQNHT